MMGGNGRDEGPLPTVGHLRGENGIRGARVYCSGLNCGRSQVITFEELGLPAATPFREIATRRRWFCVGCGGREVSVVPDWPDPKARRAHHR